MKIVHVCLACFFPDGYSYQENMLPKFHKKMGHDVEVIASLVTFDENGKPTHMANASAYVNEHGVPVTRLNYKTPAKVYRTLRRYQRFRETLDKACPDLIFVHGCQFCDIDIVTAYAKTHPQVKIIVDNHADFSNSATNWLSKNILHKFIWKQCAHKIEPYTTKFYGVLPVRVEFLKNMYKLPAEKCELLVMGADDEIVAEAACSEVKQKIRQQYALAEDDFVIVTGGKIDAFKTQTLLLMEAVQRIQTASVKLLVFGSVTPELKDKFDALCDGKKVQHIGWVDPEESYGYFAAADLVVFPGRHSVFWEQVAAQGIPMLCKRWDGTTHVDMGGNVRFLEKDSVEEIQTQIERLLAEPKEYETMKEVAMGKGKQAFSYADIARRSIDI